MNYFKLIPEKNLKSLENVGIGGSRLLAQTPGTVPISYYLLVLGKLENHLEAPLSPPSEPKCTNMYVGLDI